MSNWDCIFELKKSLEKCCSYAPHFQQQWQLVCKNCWPQNKALREEKCFDTTLIHWNRDNFIVESFVCPGTNFDTVWQIPKQKFSCTKSVKAVNTACTRGPRKWCPPPPTSPRYYPLPHSPHSTKTPVIRLQSNTKPLWITVWQWTIMLQSLAK